MAVKKKKQTRSAPVSLDNIKWQDPKPAYQGNRNTKNGRTAGFVEILKTRPNEWAVYRTGHPNCGIITYGKRTFKNTEWTSRRNPDGTYDIFARYIKK